MVYTPGCKPNTAKRPSESVMDLVSRPVASLLATTSVPTIGRVCWSATVPKIPEVICPQMFGPTIRSRVINKDARPEKDRLGTARRFSDSLASPAPARQAQKRRISRSEAKVERVTVPQSLSVAVSYLKFSVQLRYI